MIKPNKDRPLYQKILFDVLGFTLMLLSPLLGWLPGPGGIPLFLAGLSLVALNHHWAANLLNDFESKWKHFTAKLTNSGPRLTLAIDIFAFNVLCVSLFLVLTQDKLFMKLWGLGLGVLGLTLFLGNQHRLKRFSKYLFKR